MPPTRRSLLQLLASTAVFWPAGEAFATPAPTPSTSAKPNAATKRGYITFVINVHEWGHVDESAAILDDLCALYTAHGVKGDFYVTSVMADKLAASHPDTVTAMKAHGISYHVRPPQPLYEGFDSAFKALSGDALISAVRDFETYGQSLATGEIDRSRSGGYTRVKEVFGKAPCAVSAQNSNQTIVAAAASVWKAMGARMILAFHEGQSDPDNPLVQKDGLLVRPSHFKLTHVDAAEKVFWWNAVSAGQGGDPTEALKAQLDAWNHPKLPYAAALIHENNFYRAGPESWTSIYYADKTKTVVQAPPYDLTATEWGKARDSASKEAIWSAYSALVAYCAENLNVVTSEDIVALAGTSAG